MVAAVCIAVCLGAGTAAGCSRAAPPERAGDRAAILVRGEKGTLVVVDLATGSIVSRARLRSLALDVEADQDDGLFITAQCGGPGNANDDVLGIYDPARGGRVSYVKLPYPNPYTALPLGRDRFFVMNGFADGAGMVVGVFDEGARRIVEQGRVTPLLDAPVLAGGSLWSVAVDRRDRAGMLVRIDPRTLQESVIARPVDPSLRLYSSVDGTGPVYGARLVEGEVPGVVVRISRFTDIGRALETTVAVHEFADGPGRGVVVGDTLAIADFTDVVPGSAGGRVLLFSGTPGSPPIEVGVPGGPVAMTAWRGQVLVLEQGSGRVLAIDPASGTTRVLARVRGHDGLFADLAVLYGASGGARSPEQDR